MNESPIRWGILGPGKIARKFAAGLQTLPSARIQAVASRNDERRQAFATDFDVPNQHSSYETLAQDPEVDIIYVATPHTQHHEHTLLCLRAGKAVLCEKPLAVNAQQAEEMITVARNQGMYLMEGLWTYFLPAWQQVREWLDEGLIGDVHLFHADFSFQAAQDDLTHRIFNPELAGGALLDIGIYPIVMAYWVFRRTPCEWSSLAIKAPTGVDQSSGYLFAYDHGEMAILNSSFNVHGPKEAIISGSKGRIRVPMFWRADSAILEVEGEEAVHFEAPHPATGLEYEAAAAMADLRAGKFQNDLWPHADSLRLMHLMDQLRTDWGLRYPMEE